MQEVAAKMIESLKSHDAQDGRVRHQGMVLAPTKEVARSFRDEYNEYVKENHGSAKECCKAYIGGSEKAVLEDFVKGNIRTLVVVGKLREGFDHKPISVLGIVRNVAPTSTVLFAQFVGRAVRKVRPEDPVNVHIVTHQRFNQRANFQAFEQMASEDPDEEEEEEEVQQEDQMDM